MRTGRRRQKSNPIAKVLRIVGLARLALRLWGLYRRFSLALGVFAVGFVAAVAALIARRRRRRALEPTVTYAPPPTPSVTPAAPPLDANGAGPATREAGLEADARTETERRLSEEKDAG